MRQDKIYGLVLIASSVVLLVMGLTHPGRLPPTREALEHVGLIAAFAHSLAIVGVWLALWGLAGLSRFLGLERPMVVGALLAFVIPAAAVTVAAALDGFATPKLALQALDADDATRHTLHSLIGFCVLVASSLTRIYMLLGAVAIAMWSWVIHEKVLSRGLPVLGAAVALAAVGTTFGGPAYISVHVVLLLVLVQSAWMVWAGLIMIRQPAHPL
ncbi:MAG: hypothetical protein ABI821_16110 [Pseudomonadota bacterium]